MFSLPPLPRTLAAAERDLVHPKVLVRLDAVRDLGRHSTGIEGEQEQRRGLLEKALLDSAPPVRRQALLSLADLGDAQAIPSVVSHLTDPEIEVRAMALLALGELASSGDAEMVSKIRPFLHASAASIRFQALSALCRLAEGLPFRELKDAFQDKDPWMRCLALRLFLDAYGEDAPKAQRPPVESLRNWLVEQPEDEVFEVRFLRELLLCELGESVSGTEISRVVIGECRTQEPIDEQMAIEWAGRRRMESARRGLVRRARGFLGMSTDPFRYQAVVGLALLGDEKARVRVEHALSRASFRERTMMAYAVGRLRASAFGSHLEVLSRASHLADPEVLAEAVGRVFGGRPHPGP